ncbi:hypothetical protein [Romboutsia sp. MSSM.1001216sp_RTP31141st1_G3_RTP31141_220114]|uniref:hypothetical protein n=1 Tax=unclassified Romboutsia TaxID=2626894 RepID=UPI0031B5A537
MDSKNVANRKNVYFRTDKLDYIKKYQKENNINTFSKAVDNIILEHKMSSNQQHKILEIDYDILAQKIFNNIKTELLKSLIININLKEK